MKAIGANPSVDVPVVSAARNPASAERSVPDERPRLAAISLTVLSTVLSAATIWFVLVPAIGEAPPSRPSCEVVVTGNGTIVCANGTTLPSG